MQNLENYSKFAIEYPDIILAAYSNENIEAVNKNRELSDENIAEIFLVSVTGMFRYKIITGNELAEALSMFDRIDFKNDTMKVMLLKGLFAWTEVLINNFPDGDIQFYTNKERRDFIRIFIEPNNGIVSKIKIRMVAAKDSDEDLIFKFKEIVQSVFTTLLDGHMDTIRFKKEKYEDFLKEHSDKVVTMNGFRERLILNFPDMAERYYKEMFKGVKPLISVLCEDSDVKVLDNLYLPGKIKDNIPDELKNEADKLKKACEVFAQIIEITKSYHTGDVSDIDTLNKLSNIEEEPVSL